MKMAFRSFFRNRRVTVISIAAVLAMTVFLLTFANSIRLNQISLNEAFDSLEVTARIRGATGDPYLEEERFQAIVNSGFVEEYTTLTRFQQRGDATLQGVSSLEASAMLREALGGALAWAILGATAFQPGYLALVLVCFLLGGAAAVWKISGINVFTILTARE